MSPINKGKGKGTTYNRLPFIINCSIDLPASGLSTAGAGATAADPPSFDFSNAVPRIVNTFHHHHHHPPKTLK